MPTVIKFHCRHCGQPNNLLSSQPVQDPQAIRDAAHGELIAELMNRTHDPEQIGTCVILMHLALRQENEEWKKPKQRDVAKMLGLTEAAVSTGLDRARERLARLRKLDVKFLPNCPQADAPMSYTPEP